MNRKDLMFAYWIIKNTDPEDYKNPAGVFNLLLKEKERVRKYNREKAASDPVWVINDKGDTCTALIYLPEYINSVEDAEYYFRNKYYMEYIPRAWDCTGQIFTSWYKIVRRSSGRYVVYHRICCDC